MVGTLVTDQDSTSDNCCNELVGSYIIGDLGEFQNDNQGQPKFNGLFISPTSLIFKQQLVAEHLLSSGGQNFGILVFPDVVCCQPKVDCYYDCGYWGNCEAVDSSNRTSPIESDLRSFSKSISFDDSNIRVYPSPISSRSYLKVESSNSVIVKDIELYDVAGNLLKAYRNLNYEGLYEINLSEVSSGMYILRVKTKLGEVVTKRIFIK